MGDSDLEITDLQCNHQVAYGFWLWHVSVPNYLDWSLKKPSQEVEDHVFIYSCILYWVDMP